MLATAKNTRDAKSHDISRLVNIDLKCFYEPLDTDEWAFLASHFAIKVATERSTVIGFIVFSRDQDLMNTCRIHRFGVTPAHQNKGFGAALLAEVEEYCRLLGLNTIVIDVPENFCDPSTSDCSGWFLKHGFRGSFIKGHEVDDIRFTKQL